MKNPELKTIIITEEQLKNRTREIARLIDERYQNESIVLIGLLKGSYVFVSDIARQIKNPQVLVEFMVVSSYKNGASIGEITIALDLKESIENKKVIIVEDIIDTGRTLFKIKSLLIERGAKSVEIAAMCSKPSQHQMKVNVDYPTFLIPNEIVVGYGLDYNEKYRHLPYVASITEETRQKYFKP